MVTYICRYFSRYLIPLSTWHGWIIGIKCSLEYLQVRRILQIVTYVHSSGERNGVRRRAKATSGRTMMEAEALELLEEVTLNSELYSSKQGHSNKTKHNNRTIQTSWYEMYSWISVCTNKHKIYCRVCWLSKQQKLLSSSVMQSSPFIAERFGSWNKALECMKKPNALPSSRKACM